MLLPRGETRYAGFILGCRATPRAIDFWMADIAVLNGIMEAELAGVVRYTKAAGITSGPLSAADRQHLKRRSVGPAQEPLKAGGAGRGGI